VPGHPTCLPSKGELSHITNQIVQSTSKSFEDKSLFEEGPENQLADFAGRCETPNPLSKNYPTNTSLE